MASPTQSGCFFQNNSDEIPVHQSLWLKTPSNLLPTYLNLDFAAEVPAVHHVSPGLVQDMTGSTVGMVFRDAHRGAPPKKFEQ